MIIAVDISPIDKSSKSSHKVRGVGRYITLLKENLEKFDHENKYIFTSNPKNLEKVDLLHFPYFDPFFVTLPVFKKNKTVVTIHDLIPITHSKHFPVGVKGNTKWQLNKFLIKKVNGIITDSKASKDAVISNIGFDEKKVFPVLLCVEERFKKLELQDDEKKALQEKYGLPDEFFLYVGDVTWNKNLPHLVEAVKKVKIPLVMVGKALTEDYDKNNPWNFDRINVEKETDNKLFVKTGFVSDEDLVKIYNMALALLMPSLDEGFGLPVLEAMSCGCPVLTSKNGSLPEVGGDAVIYANPENIEDIATQMLKFKNVDLRQELSVKGLAQSKKFTTERFISDTVKVYESFNV